jgi:uncharacterized tellurite resistance protein B-like protein
MSRLDHEAIDNPLEERIGYATVVALMAAADDEVDERERNHLTKLCDALALPSEATKEVLAAAEAAEGVDVKQAMSVLRGSDLRFTLFTDCLLVAYADEEVVPAEEEQLQELAGALAIDDEQQAALRKLARAMHGGEVDDAEALKASLRAANIPTRPLAYVSAAGFGVVGSTVGLGALAAALGIPTGIGALVGLGVGTMIGVRWLHRQLDREDVAAEV